MSPAGWNWRHGTHPMPGRGWRFQVWAPSAKRVDLHVLSPRECMVAMKPRPNGYFRALTDDLEPGSRYRFVLDGSKERPDPASRCQPEGVHGPSQVVDPSFGWQDEGWQGLPLEQYVLYELHVGAFTPEGTFEAVIPFLPYLRDLGVTVIELMPVAQFPGNRNWGYDGVFPFAVQHSYGGQTGLKRLVDACHRQGLGVALDVVYNHLGPEGNYFADFGPYFTETYNTPWGPALNFDGPASDEVRRFFLENALHWVAEFHMDALRLDAIHAVFDRSAYPFLEELGETVHLEGRRLNRHVHVIPESDLNDARITRPKRLGGMGLDAQWNDDFHHALHTVLTGDRSGYYCDFGEFRQLAKAYRTGFVYSGQYSKFRRRRHGSSSGTVPARQFVVFCQNHDQVGNRMLGERSSGLVSFESLKLAAGAVLLSPFVPLLFMGEEYGETAPFLYFVSHSDSGLIEAVRKGRRGEFAAFAWQAEPPDPQSVETFERSKLNHELRGEERHRRLLDFYRKLTHLRKTVPCLARLSKEQMEVVAREPDRVLCLRRWWDNDEALLLLSFGDAAVAPTLRIPAGRWRKLLDSSDRLWMGPGGTAPDSQEGGREAVLALNPRSLVVYRREQEF
ncbi:MAG: malto-oligosyltrehalose trehalohydrolase [Bryobacteraceae bacterium]